MRMYMYVELSVTARQAALSPTTSVVTRNTLTFLNSLIMHFARTQEPHSAQGIAVPDTAPQEVETHRTQCARQLCGQFVHGSPKVFLTIRFNCAYM